MKTAVAPLDKDMDEDGDEGGKGGEEEVWKGMDSVARLLRWCCTGWQVLWPWQQVSELHMKEKVSQ